MCMLSAIDSEIRACMSELRSLRSSALDLKSVVDAVVTKPFLMPVTYNDRDEHETKEMFGNLIGDAVDVSGTRHVMLGKFSVEIGALKMNGDLWRPMWVKLNGRYARSSLSFNYARSPELSSDPYEPEAYNLKKYESFTDLWNRNAFPETMQFNPFNIIQPVIDRYYNITLQGRDDLTLCFQFFIPVRQ